MQTTTSSLSCIYDWRNMLRKYFPACPVDGPVGPPVPFSHMVSMGAVPKKCADCQFLFEGECTRAMDVVGDYLHLDHGPCGINGPTDPVPFEDPHLTSSLDVPRKCSTCAHLAYDSIRSFHCTKDQHIWGDLHRGLDWGAFQPDVIYLNLPPPKITTEALVRYVHDDDQVEFIREYRRINPERSIGEARGDFAELRAVFVKWRETR